MIVGGSPGLFRITITLLLTIAAAITSAEVPSNWQAAKRIARDEVYKGHAHTFYCDHKYTSAGKSGGGKIDMSGGNLGVSTHVKRAERLEWEHVVPASLMPARDFDCWTKGLPQCKKRGRKCCEKHDPNAKRMLFDLHNLVPSVGQVNAIRGNKRYGIISDNKSVASLKKCHFRWNEKTVEIAPEKRGEVARIWLYMSHKHGVRLNDNEFTMYTKWNAEHPPTETEVERHSRIDSIQGPYPTLWQMKK